MGVSRGKIGVFGKIHIFYTVFQVLDAKMHHMNDYGIGVVGSPLLSYCARIGDFGGQNWG